MGTLTKLIRHLAAERARADRADEVVDAACELLDAETQMHLLDA